MHLEKKRGKNGETVIHLLNAENEKVIPEIKITFSGLKTEKVKCVSFDGGEIASKTENSVTLKNLKTSASLIIEGA